jgi:hypothetical protein
MKYSICRRMEGTVLGLRKEMGLCLVCYSCVLLLYGGLERWLMICAVFSFTIHYSLASDDHAIHAAGMPPSPPFPPSLSSQPLLHELTSPPGAQIISQSTALAKKHNLHHPYIYQNYANVSQDVFAGYGAENHGRLKEIAGKWDPEGVFGRRLQPGHFKL